jgi:predicted nucleotidyltransferase
VRDQLDPLVEGIQRVLGANAVGAYLHGSAVLGGLKPRSDIDVIVVTERPLSEEERDGIVALLLELSGKPRPIELDVVQLPARLDFHYFELNRPKFERGEREPWGDRAEADLASAITMALVGDTELFGPPPGDVFEPVPRADYRRSVTSYLSEVENDIEWDTRNVILTLARIWSAVATDDVHSKESAAVWALTRLPAEHQPVLERALGAYLGEPEPQWDLDEVKAYAAHVMAEIER